MATTRPGARGRGADGKDTEEGRGSQVEGQRDLSIQLECACAWGGGAAATLLLPGHGRGSRSAFVQLFHVSFAVIRADSSEPLLVAVPSSRGSQAASLERNPLA